MPKKKTSKHPVIKLKKGVWFYPVRGSYLPCSWQGWALYVPFVTFLVMALTLAIRREHTPSDVFYAVFPQWVAAAVVMTWTAKVKS